MQRIALLSIFLSFAALTAPAQTNKKITIPYKQATGLQLTGLVQKETGYLFSFDEPVAERLKKKIEIPTSSATVDDILLLLHRSLQLTWEQIGNSIVLSLEPAPVKRQPASSGSIKGRVVDFETTQPLPGATITVQETGRSVLSDDRGYYVLTDLSAGVYTLTVTYAGYQKNYLPSLRVDSSRQQVLDIRMQTGNSLSEVEVRSDAHRINAVTHTTDRQLIREIRSANTVLTGISSEQISKSADRNAAQVVQRSAGITIKDDKFPIVRGMDTRYNVIYLNDNIAPSTELYSRTFALDLIPSRIIDRVLVYKSPSPEIYGDMSGGAIKIYTKDAKQIPWCRCLHCRKTALRWQYKAPVPVRGGYSQCFYSCPDLPYRVCPPNCVSAIHWL